MATPVNLDALIYHKESISVGKQSALKEYFMNRNRILFERRNATAFQFFIFSIYIASYISNVRVFLLPHRNWINSTAIIYHNNFNI